MHRFLFHNWKSFSWVPGLEIKRFILSSGDVPDMRKSLDPMVVVTTSAALDEVQKSLKKAALPPPPPPLTLNTLPVFSRQASTRVLAVLSDAQPGAVKNDNTWKSSVKHGPPKMEHAWGWKNTSRILAGSLSLLSAKLLRIRRRKNNETQLSEWRCSATS